MTAQSFDATAPVRVFLSYAWESSEYRLLVEQLAVRLTEDGIEARLDSWHAREEPIPAFISSEIRHAGKILVVCSPGYRHKVEEMEDGKAVYGAGWEMMLMTAQIYTGEVRGKVIPALLAGTWKESAPLLLQSLPYYDLTDPARFEREYLNLLRALTGHQATAPPVKALPANLDPPKVPALRFLAGPAAPNLSALLGAAGKALDRGYSKEVRFRLNAANASADFLAQISDRLEDEDIAIADWSLQHDGQCRLLATSQRPDLDSRLRAIFAEIKEIQSAEH